MATIPATLALLALALASSCARAQEDLSNCNAFEVDFIVNEGDATAKAIEDDIVADLAKVGIKVNTRLLPKDKLNTAMVNGDFNLCFSETWGAPYDPQAFAASWSTPDEAYFAALEGLPEPHTKAALTEKIKAASLMVTEAEREEAWTEILSALHAQATEVPFSGKRIPAVISKRLTGYRPGQQQFDYPAHTLRVLSGPKTISVAPGAQTGLFSNDTGVGRLDPHTYRPNEFFANNWVYDGLCEYGPQGTIVPSLAESWTVKDADNGGQEYTFNLRKDVKFHDGEEWNCPAAKLNFDHVLAEPLKGPDYHGWYALPAQIESWRCEDGHTFVITTKGKYYPLLQELTFIRPLRMMSPTMFEGGLESDPIAQNSCASGWGNVTDEASGITVECAGMVGGGVSEGGSASGTGRWKYVKTDKDASGGVQAVHFAINEDHWDAPSGSHVEELIIRHYPTHQDVKAALLDGSLDAVMGSGVLTEAEVMDIKRNHNDKLAGKFAKALSSLLVRAFYSLVFPLPAVSLTEPMQNRIIVLNTGKAPTDSLQNRKVIIHAIDKASIIDKELAGMDEPAISLFPKNAPYSGAHLTPLPDYDPEKAQLLNCPSV